MKTSLCRKFNQKNYKKQEQKKSVNTIVMVNKFQLHEQIVAEFFAHTLVPGRNSGRRSQAASNLHFQIHGSRSIDYVNANNIACVRQTDHRRDMAGRVVRIGEIAPIPNSFPVIDDAIRKAIKVVGMIAERTFNRYVVVGNFDHLSRQRAWDRGSPPRGA